MRNDKMQTELRPITLGALTARYKDDGEGGVIAYGGLLNVRPPYQREFIYKDEQRDLVIDTVLKDRPLNIMYWSDNGEGEKPRWELIDGQQRTISICQFAAGEFAVDFDGGSYYYSSLPSALRADFDKYELLVYDCRGSDEEKLAWFKIVNVAGERLNEQELRNATYHGPWLSDAKQWFSRLNCAAYKIGGNFVKGTPIRQDYLETAIDWWAGGKDRIAIKMSACRADADANALWLHYQAVIAWAKAIFGDDKNRAKYTKGVNWGFLYGKYKDERLVAEEIRSKVTDLIKDDEVQKKSGIYYYVLGESENCLGLRQFSDSVKTAQWEKQGRKCAYRKDPYALDKCTGDKELPLAEAEADHKTPWSKGGKTESGNCAVACRPCNRAKGAKEGG